ncbi:NAD+ synthase [Paracoccus sp. ME4]|uniref:NAD+ synthase n=1 Tax=Paracoccus sp. ME4 TaxID=3138066 RepID=UPI00398B3F7C
MNTDRLRLTLVQGNPMTGDISGNAGMVLDRLHDIADAADLIVFSECFLTGYPVNDLVLRPGFLREVDEAIAMIRTEVMRINGPAILLGAPRTGAGLPYNSAYLIEPTGAVRIVDKTELPNTDVFDERRTFAMSAVERHEPLAFRGFNLGVQICEDMWHGKVSASLAAEMADILVVLNGSPYQRDKWKLRQRIARARVVQTGLPLIYVNQVGGQDELVFDGGSFTMNRVEPGSGRAGIMEANAFAADRMSVVLVRGEDGLVHIEADNVGFFDDHQAYPQDPIVTDYLACVLGLRDYIRKTGAERVFVGVSGGLDSALVLAMAVDALGRDKVVGVMMPSEHTGRESLDLADELMTRLGVHKELISIAGAYIPVDVEIDAAASRLGAAMGLAPAMNVTRENFQARLRGLHLMGLSNALGGIVLSTGNKSEVAVGYCTLYGDMVGGFNPLKSVYKSDAFEMARWRNRTRQDMLPLVLMGPADPIPAAIISRPPTAELSEGQTDEAALGTYELLDAVLKALIEDRMDPASAARHVDRLFGPDCVKRKSGGHDAPGYVDRIAGLVRGAQYKRVQAPPGVKLNVTDFGAGWRYPIAGRYSL